MGITKNQLLSALNVSKTYGNDEIAESEKRTSALVQALYELITNEREDALHVLKENVGIEDNPIGHILTYMGKKAPKHYLICDGSEYQITAFPLLASHILNEFGAVNYFGGNGETTFCVPDLRGEFLRGSGENSHENNGNGAEVGEHQDATLINDLHVGPNTANLIQVHTFTNVTEGSNNGDTKINSSRYINFTTAASNSGTEVAPKVARLTTRPTNTSVLYCIKYEPTFYIRAGSDTDYNSLEETCIGTAPNGKPLYRKWVTGTIPATQTTSIASGGVLGEYPKDIELIWNIKGLLCDATTGRPLAPLPYVHYSTSEITAFFYTVDAAGNLTLNFRRGSNAAKTKNTIHLCLEYTKLS